MHLRDRQFRMVTSSDHFDPTTVSRSSEGRLERQIRRLRREVVDRNVDPSRRPPDRRVLTWTHVSKYFTAVFFFEIRRQVCLARRIFAPCIDSENMN